MERTTQEPAVRVDGIGGVFLKANNPSALAQWYAAHFGLIFQSGDSGCEAGQNYWLEFVYREDSDSSKRAATVFAIQSAKAQLPAERHQVELNFRVPDLEKFLKQLTEAGVPIEKRENYGYGRFAWIKDPEGNRIELFQPL